MFRRYVDQYFHGVKTKESLRVRESRLRL
jgi:hypothetical protein